VDSKEAQHVINEVLAVLEETALDKYSVIGVKAKSEYSDGYTVCVKGFLGDVRKTRIFEIATKHGLHAREDLEGLLLYKSNTS
jgi:hypothetical protein